MNISFQSTFLHFYVHPPLMNISNKSSTAYFKKTNSYWLFVQVTYGIIVPNALAVVTERLRIITRDTGKCYCLRTYLSWFIQCKINFRIYRIWSSFHYEIVNCQIWMIYLFYLFIYSSWLSHPRFSLNFEKTGEKRSRKSSFCGNVIRWLG